MTTLRANELAFARRMIRLMGVRGCARFAEYCFLLLNNRALMVDATEIQEIGIPALAAKHISKFEKHRQPRHFIEIAKEIWAYVEARDGTLIRARTDPEWMEKTEEAIRKYMAHGIDSRRNGAQ